MVIMENYYTQDKCRELWLKIDQLHLSYLEMEESTEKIAHRTKLEECILDFLFLAHHRSKFVFAETEDVLYRSAAFKKDFSGYKAATGWNSLQIYAANLLTQPWRKEYHLIKTYCGFYKHQIEANLVAAETIFEAMGYKNFGNGILALDGPICPDKVSNISRDCLVAYVECQILKHIWEELSPIFNLNWLDILEYRSTYAGNLDQCIRAIKFKYNQKQFHTPPRSSRGDLYENSNHPTSPPSQISITNGVVPSVSSNYVPYGSHNHVALPVVPSVPYCVPHTNGCPNSFPAYNCVSCPTHMPPVVKQPAIIAPSNVFYYQNALPTVLPAIYPVPTGQLIEVEARNGYDMVDEGHTLRNRRHRTMDDDRLVKNDTYVQKGVSDDNGEAEENWDYVFKDLKKQGYSKDLGERGDVLGLNVSDKQRRSSRDSRKIKTTNLDEAMNSLTVSDRPLKMTEALEQIERKTAGKEMLQPRERRHSQGSSYENVGPSETAVRSAMVRSTQAEPKEPVDAVVTKSSEVEVKKIKDMEKVSVTKWECKSCTYLNDLSKEICEICSKSRHQGQDQPMEVGGAECSKCTLVNPRTTKVCQACGTSLKDSPTYI